MNHTIACRPGCLGLPLPEALAALKRAGLNNVELEAPTDGDYQALAAQARAAGVKITSLSVGTQVDDPATLGWLHRVIAGAREIGVPIIFVAASLSGEHPD